MRSLIRFAVRSAETPRPGKFFGQVVTIFEYRERQELGSETQGPLTAVALTDRLEDGLSMVYSYFDTSQPNRSLGTYMILDHISRARQLGLPYVYLGYWVSGSQKMAYKARFKPLEGLRPEGWEVLADD